jgi:hypothetical protein
MPLSQRRRDKHAASQKFVAALQPGFVFLLFWGIASHVSAVMAQSPGTFTPTGNMTTPRAGHTATLLLNGKVLTAGGGSAGVGGLPPPVLASAELYDPDTGTFAGTGDMTAARQWHTATLLPDGKVLIAGGSPNFNIDSILASAELYDPSTGAFTATGDMITASPCPTATLLGNGKVFAGDIAGPPPYTAELYDPATGTFAATGTYASTNDTADNNNMLCSTATLLTNGKVLVTMSNLNGAVRDESVRTREDLSRGVL